MLSVRKRSRVYRLEGRVQGQRIRCSLGTRSQEAAILVANKVERALVEGGESKLWDQLSTSLPSSTFRKLAAIVGYSDRPRQESPTWDALLHAFASHASQLIARGKLRATTWKRYRQTLDAFSEFLVERGVEKLEDIKRPLLEDFKAWRLERILARKQARGGGGLDLDIAILHRVFAYAVEYEMVARNPVKMEGKPGSRPERGAQPFTAEELALLRQSVRPDELSFLLLRWTGLRGSDAVTLRWEEIDWKNRGINRLTQKRSKRVWIPLHPELLFALETEREQRQPQPDESVLLNPTTRKPLTRPRLYARMRALGQRAGVSHVHPHRFRDTFAVDLLLKGASPYDVAKLLGDTIQTVETHYAPFVRELRERARLVMESTEGLEAVDTDWAHSPARQREVH